MPDTYTQLHIQFVFAVKYRASLISDVWKDRLHQYITGIFQNNKHKMLCLNSMPDHIHILIGMRPHQSVSGLMQIVKSKSSKWVNDNGLCKKDFAWQEGYGAFSYSKSHLKNVIRYIQNQEEHHRKRSFIQEYKGFLKAFEIDYEENYIFHEPQ